MLKKIFTFCLILLLSVPVGIKASGSEPVADRYVAMALQGDLRPAVPLFAAMDPVNGPLDDFALAKRFRSRFISRDEDAAPETGDAKADALLLAYRTYWRRVLMGELNAEQAARALEAELAAQFADGSSGGKTERSRYLGDHGFHHLETTAPPLLDLFLWKKEYSRDYSVRLTDRSRTVRVTFMGDMISKGWKEYASLGLTSTTGWVEQGRLYCVEWAYDRTSERFTISFLKHEARHLVDLERYPGLSSAELEYRAKLTELAFASTSLQSLLDDFTSKSADNPESPHAQANYRVSSDLYRELYGQRFPGTGAVWPDLDITRVNSAARALLERNSREIGAGGR